MMFGLVLSIPHVVEAEAGISSLLFASFHKSKGAGRGSGVCIHVCWETQGCCPAPAGHSSPLWHTNTPLDGPATRWAQSTCRSLCPDVQLWAPTSKYALAFTFHTLSTSLTAAICPCPYPGAGEASQVPTFEHE